MNITLDNPFVVNNIVNTVNANSSIYDVRCLFAHKAEDVKTAIEYIADVFKTEDDIREAEEGGFESGQESGFESGFDEALDEIDERPEFKYAARHAALEALETAVNNGDIDGLNGVDTYNKLVDVLLVTFSD